MATNHTVGNIVFPDGTVQTTAATGGGGGVTSVGAVTDPATDDKGAVISGTAISMEKADATHYGVVKGTFSGTSTGTNTGDQTITLTSDVTGSGTGSFATTIANSAVTNAKMANMADQTFKGNVSGGSAAPSDLSVSQMATALGIESVDGFLFGAGQDGNLSSGFGTITLSSDKYYGNITFNSTDQIITNGWRLFANGTVDMSVAKTFAISANGNVGASTTTSTGGTGGAAIAATGTQTCGVNAAGGAGGNGTSNSGGSGTNPSAAGTPANGGNPGTGGFGGGGTTGGGGSGGTIGNTNTPWVSPRITDEAICRRAGTTFTLVQGGCGGGGGGGGGGATTGPQVGGGGGGGGAGGMPCWIALKTIQRGTNTNPAIISAEGGAGGNGANAQGTVNCGGGAGGAGGGGGFMVLIYKTLLGSTVTNGVSVSGGLGGTGGTGKAGSANPIDGAGGGSGGSGYLYKFDVTAGTLTYVAAAAATAAPSAGTRPGVQTLARRDL